MPPPRLRYPMTYSALWLLLALATLVVIAVANFDAIVITAAALAWLGGIITERLRTDVAGHRARRATTTTKGRHAEQR